MRISKTSKTILAVAAFVSFGFLTGCSNPPAADVASANLSKAADQFEVNRRIVFYNGITNDYMLSVEGRCSIHKDNEDNQLEVTCAVGEGKYKKHFLGLSDNVTYFVEQLEGVSVDTYHYRVIYRPSTIIPDVEID